MYSPDTAHNARLAKGGAIRSRLLACLGEVPEKGARTFGPSGHRFYAEQA